MKIYVVYGRDDNTKSVVIPNSKIADDLNLKVESGEGISEYNADDIGIKKELLLDFDNEKIQKKVFSLLKSLPRS